MAARLLGGGVRPAGRSACCAFGGGDRCALYAALACLVLALVLWCCLGVVFLSCCGAPSLYIKKRREPGRKLCPFALCALCVVRLLVGRVASWFAWCVVLVCFFCGEFGPRALVFL